jgi:hypothetical protein
MENWYVTLHNKQEFSISKNRFPIPNLIEIHSVVSVVQMGTRRQTRQLNFTFLFMYYEKEVKLWRDV